MRCVLWTGGKALFFPDFKTKKSSRRWYQHDIDVIIYSEMFRKMQPKSQLLSIHDPVSRSRLIHTFEVVRIAKEISEKLESYYDFLHFQYSLHFVQDRERYRYLSPRLMKISEAIDYLNRVSVLINDTYKVNYILFDGLNDSREKAEELKK